MGAGLLLLLGARAPFSNPARKPAEAAAPFHADLRKVRERNRLPALVVGVVTADGRVVIDVQGRRSANGAGAVSREDLFHLGSAVKPMVADLWALILDELKVSWDQPLGTLDPGLFRHANPRYASATLRQLLAHEAGLPPYTKVSLLEWQRLRSLPGAAPDQREAFLREALAQPPAAPVGERLYSNAGYILAGHLAERLTGTPFEQLFRERLLEPLGMGLCRPGWPQPETDAPLSAPLGHRWVGSGPAAVLPSAQPEIGGFLAPAGDLSCPPDALARYLSWHLRALAGRPQALRLPYVCVLHGTCPPGAPPLGWGRNRREEDGAETQAILGSLELFSALLALVPSDQRAAFALTNVGETAQVQAALVDAVRRVERTPLSAGAAPQTSTGAASRLEIRASETTRPYSSLITRSAKWK
jgi:D-alanyl-D-alanine carboxypeptidase